VHLSISDTGTGMDEENKGADLRPLLYYQGGREGNGSRPFDGHGIVKQHNGYIAVHSEPGAGTTIHVYLPVVDSEVRGPKPAPQFAKGGNETVLVAEDNEVVRRLIRTILTEYDIPLLRQSMGQMRRKV